VLASAHPLFEDLPGTFADPLGLADQQASGVVALIVARYDEDMITNASIATTTTEDDQEVSPHPPSPASRSSDIPRPSQPPAATYDTFVAASGGLVAVARTTPDYRFPVAPAAAVARFHAARDAGHAPALSLFAVTEADAARLLETAFYAECLKVHVDGPASADLVRAQLARCGCRSGLLEANDFSDAAAPTVRLAEVADEAPLDLAALLDGVHGRVLLYDRAKNQAVAYDRASAPLDLAAAIAEADRLARARRSAPDAPEHERLIETPLSPPLEIDPEAPEAPSPADVVADDLRQRAEQSAPPSPLSALVAELQGRAPASALDEPEAIPAEAPASPGNQDAPDGAPPSLIPSERSEHPPSPPPQAAPHPLAPDLDRLRTDAYVLLEDAVGRERAAALDAHVRAEHGIPSPVPSERTIDHLRALLLDSPPKRWHLFKRARAKTHGNVAALLLAFHAAHGHDARPLAQGAVMQATQLWTRLHK
jgi:hypothetical protein